jgi:hypothetical protein
MNKEETCVLTLIIPGNEFFDEATEMFVSSEEVVLTLEHSLLSLSKWESKHLKPFLGPEEKTVEEIFSYVQAMILTEDYPEDCLTRLSEENLNTINEYINSPQSGTTFREDVLAPSKKKSGEIISSELLYYWLVAFNIPFDCETWHLNRLLSLIRICNIKNSKPKKMSRSEMIAQRHTLNEQRKSQIGTSG